MRITLACVTSVISMAIAAFCASPAFAQTRVTSLEELRHELAAGDLITIVTSAGQPVAGRLVRLGDADLDIRLLNGTTREGPQDLSLPLDAVLSIERPRDSVRNGALIGAGIGAAYGAALFVHAVVVDLNEMDEWAPLYAGATAISTGIGALIGWAIDAGRSKPHIRFDASSGERTRVSVRPVYTRGLGIALAVSFSR
jgi:HAMP domain-containing protein